MTWKICFVIFGFVGGISSVSPPTPVKYPENYCENFKNDETFDFVIIGSGNMIFFF